MSDAFIIPRIESVFYAEFDHVQGPVIRLQVPENLIREDVHHASVGISTSSNTKNTSPTSFKTTNKSGRESVPKFLFPFNIISRFVIPRSEFCGRLVICTTPRHRVMGFPVVLQHRKRYIRQQFRFNVCFVFKQDTDPTCYEPIVRKVARVITTCERETAFLSSPESPSRMLGILEQLFEDLNSFSETSTLVHDLNYLDLRIFPHYPNPPPVADWDVPVPLINLEKKQEPNWDLTIIKILPYVNGIYHIHKIARFAEVRLALVRQCISHLLLYQCIMLIDIFQFSNIYCLSQSITWLARNENIAEECGIYVTKSGFPIPPWSTLLWLYSRLKSPKNVRDWISEYKVDSMGLDARRFLTFGVIKGFVRRVHRWPILIAGDKPKITTSSRKRGKSVSGLKMAKPGHQSLADSLPPQTLYGYAPASSSVPSLFPATEISGKIKTSVLAPEESMAFPNPESHMSRANRHSQEIESPLFNDHTISHQRSSQLGFHGATPSDTSTIAPFHYPQDLPAMLDGCHHSDELCAMFEVSWEQMERYLSTLGQRDGESSQVFIIYR